MFVRYASAKIEILDREEAYRIYISDMVRVAAMDIGGRDELPRFCNLLQQHNGDDDAMGSEADPEEIIQRIVSKLNK